MDEFLEQFLIESRELVEQGTADLLGLEEDPANRERLDSAFRAFHTLKGAAGIVDFLAMGQALHAVEESLSRARAGDLAITVQLIGDCLGALDQVVQWLDAMQADGEQPDGADRQAAAIIARFAAHGADFEPPAPSAPGTTPDDAPRGGAAGLARGLLEAQRSLLTEAQRDAPTASGTIASATRVCANVLRSCSEPSSAARVEAASSADELLAILSEVLAPGDPSGAEAPLAPSPDAASRAAPERARSLRVDVDRVDDLANVVGELTVVKNAIGHLAGEMRATHAPKVLTDRLKSQADQFDRLVAELLRSVLNLRVLPMGQVFQRFPRLLREMAAQTGKPVRLIIDGEAVEADKAVVESLFEPLLHVVRNAIDHGVEPPAQRLAAGKPAVATITLRGLRDGEHVVVEVSDDGVGVDVGRVRQTAAARALVPPDTLSAMPDETVVDLIFAPGFSTAETVSALSGRGVGMDAVRTAVERLGGRAAIQSRPGEGATVRFVMPFSVMVSRVMTVQSGDQWFGVPLDAVVETVRLSRDRIVPVGAGRAVVLRDRTVPVIDLAAALGGRDRTSAGDAYLVIATIGGGLSGLEVDRFGEQMDVMLRPMGGLLSGHPGVAGTTLLGDGSVLIVLDLKELLR